MKYFNAIDRNDRDSADYSTSIRPHRYCIRIMCWVLDRVVHTCFAVVNYCVSMVVINVDWKCYTNRNNGRQDFQIDLGLAILNYGIGLDWVGDERPDYMHTGVFIPCNCKKCYFCLNGHTSGIDHANQKRLPVVEYKCGTRVKTKKCSVVRVDLCKGGSYCRMCYRNTRRRKRHAICRA